VEGLVSTRQPTLPADRIQPLEWGFVGTGKIAGWMATVVRSTSAAVLSAVASRRMGSARSFAAEHRATRAFDSWQEMLAWDRIDAVYIATPTSLREEIAVAAASAGKHVLGEKPFAGFPSIKRITGACRAYDVCFMDATHFVHHPRFAAICDDMTEKIGRPRSLDSRFLVSLKNRHDIRYDPALEPLGALGDLGWYNMRASLEYLAPDDRLRAASASIERDEETGAVIAGEGLLEFGNDSVSRWRCSFTAGEVDIGLRLSGPLGMLCMDDFVGENEDSSASFTYVKSGAADTVERVVRIDSCRSAPALMFENFAAAVWDRSQREPWMQASERTQALLDAVQNAS
jgi:predicted dehydrogenase